MIFLIKNFLIDLDGVIYEGSNIIPGAFQAIDFLQKNNFPFLLFTNTNSRTKNSLMRKLANFGFNVQPENVFTALDATIEFIKSKKPAAKIFSMQNKEVMDFMQENSLELVKNEFERVDFVVLGVDYENTFSKMDLAFRLLLNTKAELILVSGDRFYPGGGKLIMGPGGFAKALEFASGKQAILIGKPSPNFFEIPVKKFGFKDSETLYIGDTVDLDVEPAKKVKLKTMLVKTGNFSEKEFKNSKNKPDYLLKSIADLPKWIEKNH